MTQTTRNKQPARQSVKKYAVFTLMFVVFGICLWWIFAPSAAERLDKQQQAGFNTTLPDPEDAGIVRNKKTAYEQEQQRLKAAEKIRSLEEYAFSLEQPDGTAAEELPATQIPADPRSRQLSGVTSSYSGTCEDNSFAASDAAYRQIEKTLHNFYDDPPQENIETARLREEVEALRASLAAQTPPQSAYDEQVALMEKSYELAAKYLPGQQGRHAGAAATGRSGNVPVVPVAPLERSVVSALGSAQGDSAQLATPHRQGFNTAVGMPHAAPKNTILACVDGDQTLIDGQRVRLRLLAEMLVGGSVLPCNTPLVGVAKIQGERLNVTITSIEYRQTVLPVALIVYDCDGQQGICVPHSAEISAAKEVAANLGQNLGTTVSITNQSARDQLLAELGKGAIQGASQYVSKKIRTVKVHLKEGYRVMLRPGKD